jgi:carbamoylphosphate synthase large subunit
VLEEYGVKVIGVEVDAIERGEDRIAFKETMDRLGIEMPRSEAVYSVEDAEAVAGRTGYPVVIRPAYTWVAPAAGWSTMLKTEDCGVARIGASMVGQILVEESVLGWEELELEVVRDAKNQMITVCFIENVDAMGVHTGDSYCTAPMLTIDEELAGTPAATFVRHCGSHSGDRRHQHPVCPRSRNRPGGGDRNQSAHVPVLRVGVQGHGVSHCSDPQPNWPAA